MTDRDFDERVISSIAGVVGTMPDSAWEFYESLPGRSPHEAHKELSLIVNAVGEENYKRIVADVADMVVFSLLGLIDSNFKNQNIATSFKDNAAPPFREGGLVDLYRSHVGLGGRVRR